MMNSPSLPQKRPELLAPAGSVHMMHTAFRFGADAIYAGQPRYSLRVRENEFGKLDTLATAIQGAHTLGKKFYVVSNILPHNTKVKTYIKDMAPVIALSPDALIMSDPGLIALVRETWPEMEIHLSVQANTLNTPAIRFWKSVGITRVILSRELSLDEIEEIRQECPDMELEVFIHGALCIAYSGRCLLSGYFNHRDANQGSCTNACRWEYRVGEEKVEKVAPTEKVWLLEEKERPGEFMPIEEDEHGTYILNSKDLRALQHIHRLVAIGVDALKIEGRTKSPYYVARAVQVYREAIHDALQGRDLNPALFGALEGLSNRGYTDGFLTRHTEEGMQNYLRGHSESRRSRYVGDVVGDSDAEGWVEIDVKNRFSVGDRLEIIHPEGNFEYTIEAMRNRAGESITCAPGNGHRVLLKFPQDATQAMLACFLKEE